MVSEINSNILSRWKKRNFEFFWGHECPRHKVFISIFERRYTIVEKSVFNFISMSQTKKVN